MAKATFNKPKWRRHKEMMLGIEYPGDGKRKWAISQMIKRKNEELIKEEQEMWERGFCPNCNMAMTTDGKCSMGCGYERQVV